MARVGDRLRALGHDECLDLIGTVPVGRLAYAPGGIPAVIPVNICLQDGLLYFHLGTGAALRAVYSRDLVVIEVDSFDPDRSSGWSVNVLGVAKEVPPARLAASAPKVISWARSPTSRLFSLDTDHVSGRRLTPEPSPPASGHD